MDATKLALALGLTSLLAACQAGRDASARIEKTWRFDFGGEQCAAGFVPVRATTRYDASRGFGFTTPGAREFVREASHADPDVHDDFCTSDQAMRFVVDVGEGNYEVEISFGDHDAASSALVLAESRRLMVPHFELDAGEFRRCRFLVNVRNDRIPGGGAVRLNKREIGVAHWDDSLTLEIRNGRPCICAIEIRRRDDLATVYLAGDSTVTDQPKAPAGSWGQALPAFFEPERFVIANHAESGESLKGFVAKRRLDKLLSTMRAGDYLLLQFAHNDMKKGAYYADEHGDYSALLRRFAMEARARGATPVFVTSMHRRFFKHDGTIRNTLEEYPAAMRALARELDVLCLDLEPWSAKFYERMGPERSASAFLPKDRTHTNMYGAYSFARWLALRIRASELELAAAVRRDIPAADANAEAFYTRVFGAADGDPARRD